jgi:hypothetical protein
MACPVWLIFSLAEQADVATGIRATAPVFSEQLLKVPVEQYASCPLESSA